MPFMDQCRHEAPPKPADPADPVGLRILLVQGRERDARRGEAHGHCRRQSEESAQDRSRTFRSRSFRRTRSVSHSRSSRSAQYLPSGMGRSPGQDQGRV